MKIVSLAVALALAVGAANAATVNVDISDQAGFTDIVGFFTSPVYTFSKGDTVNFGTAVLGSHPDCCDIWFKSYEVNVIYLENNIPVSGHYWTGDEIYVLDAYGAIGFCGDQCPVLSFLFPLQYQMQTDQIALQFSAFTLRIDPPAIPIPAALPLFLTGLGLIIGYLRCKH